MRISIQSWCFRTWSEPQEIIQATKACGLDYIELGSIYADPLRDSEYMSTINMYRTNGIEVSGHGVNGLDANQANNRAWFEFAKAIGLDSLVVSFPKGEEVETARGVEPLCEEFGIKVAIHNHGRKHNLGSPDALDRVFSHTSESIGLCLDTAWMLDSGYDPVEMAEKYRDRLHGVHLKDFIFARDGRPEDTVIGEGNLRLGALIQLLRDTGYDQFLTIEYEGDVENPVPNCKKCVEAIKTALG
ncbi:MAG: sugar phosphate isomerase/epimerase [Candidatus Poribacteria bacterium]|nr:sugar phosphate isomerase/epimerase [Candidatus Poribacteria bacterium]MDE0506020.1 sugar phosphate isomerase/epimerase [Candidatus Poribacteria bacterium]